MKQLILSLPSFLAHWACFILFFPLAVVSPDIRGHCYFAAAAVHLARGTLEAPTGAPPPPGQEPDAV